MMDKDLLLNSYDYFLPSDQIASRPSPGRDTSRLLVYNMQTGEVTHAHFYDLPKFIPSDTTLIMNRSRVFPCRLVGKRQTGGHAEVFVLSLIKEHGGYKSLVKTTRKKKIGDQFFFDRGLIGTIVGIGEGGDEGTFIVDFNTENLESVLLEIGRVPIPPYIRHGESDERDVTDYQTVYSKEVGSVACPTAGLHFTPEVLAHLKENGIKLGSVTLHVGMGTFLPVKTDNILDHHMHTEQYFVDDENLKLIKESKNIFAVGTTSLRVLESSIDASGKYFIEPNKFYATDIFLHPGVEVKSIKGLITNFHLPKSTLLMLVSAIVGREKCLELYKIAVEEKYRFFSYGDSMLIIR